MDKINNRVRIVSFELPSIIVIPGKRINRPKEVKNNGRAIFRAERGK